MRLPQIFESQVVCMDGSLALCPIKNPDKVDDRRDEIGWSQTISETKSDLEIGQPCDG